MTSSPGEDKNTRLRLASDDRSFLFLDFLRRIAGPILTLLRVKKGGKM